MEPYKYENEIGRITALLDRISSDVYGNGQVGIAKSVPRLEEKINNLVGSVASHTKVISNFIEFQANHAGEIKGKKELEEREKIITELKSTQKRDKIQRRFLFVMAVIAVIGLSLTAYFGFRTAKVPAQLQQTEQTIRNSIDKMDGVSKITRGGYIKYNDGGLSDSIKIK